MEEKKWVDAIDEYFKTGIYAATDISMNDICKRIIKSLDIINDQIVLDFSKFNVGKFDLLLSVRTVSDNYKGYKFYYAFNDDYHYIKIVKCNEKLFEFPDKLPTANEVLNNIYKVYGESLSEKVDSDCRKIIDEIIKRGDPLRCTTRRYSYSVVDRIVLNRVYNKLDKLGYKVYITDEPGKKMKVLEVSLI